MQTEMHKFNSIQIQLQNRNQYKITKYVARLAERVEGGIKENWSGRQPDDLGLPLHCQGLSSSSSHFTTTLYLFFNTIPRCPSCSWWPWWSSLSSPSPSFSFSPMWLGFPLQGRGYQVFFGLVVDDNEEEKRSRWSTDDWLKKKKTFKSTNCLGDVILGGLFPVHEKSETENEVQLKLTNTSTIII